MKLKEVIKLAAEGYAVSEIREIGELSVQSPEVISIADGRKLDEIKELLSLADSEAEEDHQEEKKDQEGAGESDRKADPEIEKIKAENEKLREDLKKAQKVNASRSAENKKEDKTPEDVLVDMMLNL